MRRMGWISFLIDAPFSSHQTKSKESFQRLPFPSYHHICLLYLHRPCRQVNKVISYHVLWHGTLHKALPNNAGIQVHALQWKYHQSYKICDVLLNYKSSRTSDNDVHREYELYALPLPNRDYSSASADTSSVSPSCVLISPLSSSFLHGLSSIATLCHSWRWIGTISPVLSSEKSSIQCSSQTS